MFLNITVVKNSLNLFELLSLPFDQRFSFWTFFEHLYFSIFLHKGLQICSYWIHVDWLLVALLLNTYWNSKFRNILIILLFVISLLKNYRHVGRRNHINFPTMQLFYGGLACPSLLVLPVFKYIFLQYWKYFL